MGDALRERAEPVSVDAVSSARLPVARHETNLDRLEQGYANVVGLVESIQEHMESQGGRSERMAHSLDRLAVSLEGISGASKTQMDQLAGIGEELKSGTASTKRTEELLSHVPQMADAQRETMVSVGRQLDVLRQGNERGTESLVQLHEAIVRLSEATGASTTALKHMHVDSVAREERLTELLEEQTKRLTLFAWMAIAVAVTAMVLGLVALLR